MQKGATHVALLPTIVKLENILKKKIDQIARVIKSKAPEPLLAICTRIKQLILKYFTLRSCAVI